MSSNIQWHGDAAKAYVDGLSWDAVRRVTVFFWNACQTTLNVSNPRPYLNSSKPGEAPRKRSGFGSANVVFEFDKATKTSRVGVLRNAKYMAILELFRNRPWLMATLKKVMPQLKKIAEQSQGGSSGVSR